ncbi:MAG: glycerophosphoryl diester phosphodiesterase membrane domain-containing protein [Saccharofermentans sp.]|nr:glycerophosphoryl diester phosphodiesterase membrane domain-containing protein [Saccharofermentans sp.]
MRKLRKEKRKRTIWPYIQAIPEIVLYEAVSKVILISLVFVLKKLMMWSIYRMGKVAVSSGDFAFIFKSPYGWLAILTAIILCAVYVAFDINVIVNYAGEKVKERPTVIWKIVLESLTESARFFTPGGLLVLLYVGLIAPVVGVGMSISLTRNLYLPNFISSVIDADPLYNVMYTLFTLLMLAVGALGIFTIHGMVIDHVAPVKSFVMSSRMVIKNFRNIVKQLLLFFLKFALIDSLITVSVLLIPGLMMLFGTSVNEGAGKYGAIAFILFVVLLGMGSSFLLLPLLTMKLTQLYYQYNENVPMALKTQPVDNIKQMVFAIIAAYLCCWVVTYTIHENFELFFPAEISADLIGHRGAGTEGGENTLSGIDKAIELGCYGTEIDIQRTADGHYILNHDNTFKRVANDSRRPSEMTLEEIKSLRLISAEGNEKVPTIEEVLDHANGKIVLFIELKGATADRKMCDDVVKMIKDRSMEKDCVLISLKYNLIDYIEDNYPEIETGYLAFITLGNVGALNCDYIGLEEEAATNTAIDAAHENGRKVMVWTPNSTSSQRRFLISRADAIITDNTTQANDLFSELLNRDDFTRMIDTVVNYFF